MEADARRRWIVGGLVLVAAIAVLVHRAARVEPSVTVDDGDRGLPSGLDLRGPRVPVTRTPADEGSDRDVLDAGPAAGRDRVAVVVTDGSGRPIEDARVELVEATRVVRTTDGSGRAVLPRLEAGPLVHLHVTAADHFPALGRHAASEPVRVVLPPEASLDGLLLDYERGEAVAGEVMLDAYGRDPGCPEVLAVAGEDGTFRFGSTPAGHAITLEVRAEGYPRLRYRLDDRRAPRVVLPLAQGVELHLVVLGQMGARPLEGAEVFTQGGGEYATDAKGHVRPRVLSPDWLLKLPDHGYLDLTIRAEGHLTMTLSVEVGAFEPESSLTVFLPPAATVTGTVVDPEGRPVAGARVSFRPAVEPGIHHPLLGRLLAAMRPFVTDGRFAREHLRATVETDGEGRFLAAGLVPEIPDYLDEITLGGEVLARWLAVGTGDVGSTFDWRIVTNPTDPERATAERSP